jgi:hypothetical protein
VSANRLIGDVHHVIVVALLLLAFALRVRNLGGQSIWWDEAFTWQMTSHGWDNFWHVLLTGDRNPPLYFVSVAVWGGFAGWSEFSLRFLSVIYGVIGLAFFANLVKRLFGVNASVWALAFAACSPALTVYSQEGRMYALFFMLTAATLYFGLRTSDFRLGGQGLEIRGWRRTWPCLLCEAALLLTHYFAIPIVATLNLFAFVILFQQHAKFSAYAHWIGGQVFAALPVLIWATVVFATPGSLTLAHEPPPNVLEFARQGVVLWMTGVRDLNGAQNAMVLPVISLTIVAALGARQVNRRSAQLMLVFGAVILVPAFVLTRVLTSFHPRYLLPYSIPLFVLTSGALSDLRFDRKRTSIIAGWVAGGAALLLTMWVLVNGWEIAASPAYANDDARGVAAYLDDHAIAGDVILIEANDYTLPYYSHGPASIRMITASTEDAALTQLSDAIGGAKRVWLAHWNISTQDRRGYWRFLLEQSGSLKDWTSYHGYELYRYDIQSALREPALDANVLHTSDSLVRKWSGVEGQTDDGALTFAIEWRVPATFDLPLNASVRLMDASGERFSSVDAPVVAGVGSAKDQSGITLPTPNYYVLPVPPGTPPRVYTLTVQAYTGPEVISEYVLGTIRLPRRLEVADPYRTLGSHWHEIVQEVSPNLDLESFSESGVTRAGVEPLASVHVALRWRKIGSASNTVPHLRLIQGNRVWADVGSDFFARDYPFEQWAHGETVIDRRQIMYPPVRGPIELQVGQGDYWIPLTTLTLDESTLQFNAPSMQHAQSAQFDDFTELLGYDLKSDAITPDRPLDLTLYWQANNTEPITTAYTVFTQLIAPDGHLVAQHDAPPDLPTIAWVPGQVIADHHALKIVDATYRGPATLIVGWYNSATIVRLKTHSGEDHVALQTLVMVGNP